MSICTRIFMIGYPVISANVYQPRKSLLGVGGDKMQKMWPNRTFPRGKKRQAQSKNEASTSRTLINKPHSLWRNTISFKLWPFKGQRNDFIAYVFMNSCSRIKPETVSDAFFKAFLGLRLTSNEYFDSTLQRSMASFSLRLLLMLFSLPYQARKSGMRRIVGTNKRLQKFPRFKCKYIPPTFKRLRPNFLTRNRPLISSQKYTPKFFF